MPRRCRIDVPDVPQHIIVRGNNRSDLFREEVDRWLYIEHLDAALRARDCELHAYVLMTNHVHMLATGRSPSSISRMMHLLGTRFARRMNFRRGRTGTLFEGRFKSIPVECATYFLTVMRYIESNPVRARIATHPRDHIWSSYAANASGSPHCPLTPHRTYLGLAEDAASRGKAYAALFDQPIDEIQLAAIRSSARKGLALGSEEFRRRWEAWEDEDRPAG